MNPYHYVGVINNSYYKVKILVPKESCIYFQEEDEIIKGHIHIEATRSQIQVLRDFGSGKVSIRQVDSILSNIIRTPTTTFLEDALTYSELFLSIVKTHVSTKSLI